MTEKGHGCRGGQGRVELCGSGLLRVVLKGTEGGVPGFRARPRVSKGS